MAWTHPGALLLLPVQEPDLLRDEKAQLERALQSTAVNQYGAFIETARCMQTMSTELSSVCEHLDLVLQVCALLWQQQGILPLGQRRKRTTCAGLGPHVDLAWVAA